MSIASLSLVHHHYIVESIVIGWKVLNSEKWASHEVKSISCSRCCYSVERTLSVGPGISYNLFNLDSQLIMDWSFGYSRPQAV